MSLNTVAAGLIAGLFSSIIVLIVAKWWQKIFIPWLENRLYKGTRISGVWKTKMIIGSKESFEQATLTQYGHRIRGTINYPKDTLGRSHTYSVEGEFQDRTLTLIQHEIGHSHQDLGAIVLDFKPGGSFPKMEGLGVWSEEGKIVAAEYSWTCEEGDVIDQVE